MYIRFSKHLYYSRRNDKTGEGDLPEITKAAAGGDTLVVAGAQENREQ